MRETNRIYALATVLILTSLVPGFKFDEGVKSPDKVSQWNFEEKTLSYIQPTETLPLEAASEYYNDISSCPSAKKAPDSSILVRWGQTIPEGTDGVPCSEGIKCMDYGVAKVVITNKGNCQTVSWSSTQLSEMKDCINLYGHWYGGGQQWKQSWPIESNLRTEVPFVTADMLQGIHDMYGGVSERYWFSSSGIAVRVDDDVPLFLTLSENSSNETDVNMMCFSSKYDGPFVADETQDSSLFLTYHLCYADDIRKVYESSYKMFFAVPSGIPDEKMFTDPIWSSWAEYNVKVNDSRIIDLAQAVIDNGFNNSQIEIDDNWETCYGNAEFNPDRFSDPKGTIDTLHSMGFRATLWIHPFINNDCESFAYADQHGYFLKNKAGQTQITSWWQGNNNAGLIDFTNSEAVTWWTNRLKKLKQQTGIDSFKFDAGETSWMPKDYTLNADKKLWPNGFTTAYVDAVSQFGDLIEVRVGHLTQQKNIFVRMLDKDSNWDNTNGLATMVPSLLHSSLIGYPFVLPDMIGGNAYYGTPDSELFIRWAQSNTFMPSIQFSILPWNYDERVVNISREVTRLHSEYAPLIIELAKNSTMGGGPIARPTWWLCPTDENCLTADQQFLVGNDLLVAPIVEAEATSKRVVFPPGKWEHLESGTIYDGISIKTIEDLDISSNLFFTRVTSNN